MGTPLINQEKERMKYLREIHKTIIRFLYKATDRQLEEIMWKIAQENQILTKGTTPTFFYKEKWWPINPIRPKESSRFLDPSFYTKVEEILEEYRKEKETTRAGIETMVGNFLSIAGHHEDLHRLFPEALRNILPQIFHEIFDIKDPLPDDVIQYHLEKNKDNLKYLKKLLMTQLLLNK